MIGHHGFTTFCDDIRREQGGKITLVGVYRSEMVVHGKLPIVLPKLGLAVVLRTPIDKPIERCKFLIYMPGDAESPSITGDLNISQKQMPAIEPSEGVDHWFTIHSDVLMSPVEIKQEGYIRVRAEADGETIRIGALRVRQAEPRVKSETRPYRRRKGGDTWHYCRNCSNWPTSEYDERPTRPTSGELCNECMAKDRRGNCT